MSQIQGTDQITITDLSDGYTVVLSNEAHTFVGGISSAEAGSTTTNVYVYRGGSKVPFTFGTITGKTGISANASVDSSTYVGTVTFTVTTSLTSGGTIDIPINITGTEISITKQFSYGIAFTGATGATGKGISSSVTYYLLSSSATAPTFSTSTFVDDANTATTSAEPYLWACTLITYTDSTTSNTGVYLASKYVEDGTSVSVSSVKYETSASATTAPSSFSSTTPIATTVDEPYLWTQVIYSDGNIAYSVSTKGDTGDSAFAISITTSDGNVFKNNTGTTVLTANVFLGGVQLDETEIADYGTLNWYKTDDDEDFVLAGTGMTLEVDASDIDNKAVYTVQLEE